MRNAAVPILCLTLALAVLVLLAAGNGVTATFPRATADRPDDRTGPQVHLVYAVPSNGVDHQLDTDGTLVDSIAVWEQWFVEQTGGRVLRPDTYQGNADVTFVRLSQTASQIASLGPNELTTFKTALAGAGLNDPTKLYGVYYDGTTNVSVCGRGANLLGVVYLQSNASAIVNCAPLPFRHPPQSAQYREFIMVHELLHGLGFVPSCAPHYAGDSHVTETTDVMTGGTIGNSQVLDAGRDDYFEAPVPSCKDLADSSSLALAPPGRPDGVTAVAGDAAATVSFTQASGTVTSYRVTAMPGGVTATGTASPITVTGLKRNEATYTFTVIAMNGAENGPVSAPSNAVSLIELPAPPGGVEATAGDGRANVTFTAPASSGGAPISYYTATASPGGQSASGLGSPITVAGLENGTSYTFTVTATSALGTGPPSTLSSAVVPAGPERPHPDPPAESARADVPDVVVPPDGPRRPPPLH